MFSANQSNTQTPAQTAGNNRGNFEPAVGFLNFYLPSRDGQRVKLGAIPLKASKEREKALVDALIANPALTAQIVAKLEVDFQPVTTGEGNFFDLGDIAAPAEPPAPKAKK